MIIPKDSGWITSFILTKVAGNRPKCFHRFNVCISFGVKVAAVLNHLMSLCSLVHRRDPAGCWRVGEGESGVLFLSGF